MVHIYGNKEKIHIDEFISIEISSRRSMKERRIEELLDRIESGNTLIVSERNEIQIKVFITMFGLFAEIERDFLSERAKMGLANARARGKTLSSPVGILGKHKLDGKESEIVELPSYRVSKSAVARKFKVSRTCLVDFVKKRELHL